MYGQVQQGDMASAVQVFSCSFTEAARQENVVLKVMDMPRSIHDSCRQVGVPETPCLLGGCLCCHLAVMLVLLLKCDTSQECVHTCAERADTFPLPCAMQELSMTPLHFPWLQRRCAALLVSHGVGLVHCSDARQTLRAVQVDIFSEIAVLERFKGRSGMCQLLDYGLDGDDFIMVLRHYSGSLKAWRDQMPGSPDGQLRLYLQIFCDIVSSVQVSAGTGTSRTHVWVSIGP